MTPGDGLEFLGLSSVLRNCQLGSSIFFKPKDSSLNLTNLFEQCSLFWSLRCIRHKYPEYVLAAP